MNRDIGQVGRRGGGFTLVELLVAITIIAVLISLLAPAMDQAIYQAELATCGAQLKGMGTGLITYASGNKRRYPLQPRIERNDDQAQPVDMASGFMTVLPDNAPDDDDVRPMLRTVFSLKMLADPLCPKVDLDTQKGGGNLQLIMSTYNMWFGWQYVGSRKMAKMGDRFDWTGQPNAPSGAATPGPAGTPRTATFDLLVSDRHHLKTSAPEAQTSHPDKSGLLRPVRLQDATDAPFGPPIAFQVTFACWYEKTVKHGAMDMNYAHENGSVSRIVDQMPYDPRTFPVPERNGNKNPGDFWLFIPEQSAP